MKLASPNARPSGLPPLDPTPPDCLSGHALAAWNRIMADLGRTAIRAPDRDLLTSYCEAVGTVMDSSVQIAREGMIVRDKHGNPRRHPTVGIRHAAIQTMRLLAGELGLSPMSRLRLGVGAMPDADPLGEFLSEEKQ